MQTQIFLVRTLSKNFVMFVMEIYFTAFLQVCHAMTKTRIVMVFVMEFCHGNGLSCKHHFISNISKNLLLMLNQLCWLDINRKHLLTVLIAQGESSHNHEDSVGSHGARCNLT